MRPHQEGRARPSLFFVFDLTSKKETCLLSDSIFTMVDGRTLASPPSACRRHTRYRTMSMIHVILDKPSSAAAQGEQASEPHHADGYIFTGPDPSVQTPEDAVRQHSRCKLY